MDYFESDSGTSSGVASTINNRPDNNTQTYYQNFEEAVRDIQKLDMQFVHAQIDTVTDRRMEKTLRPDLLESTMNVTDGLVNDQVSNDPRQNIYANDDFIATELDNAERYKKLG